MAKMQLQQAVIYADDRAALEWCSETVTIQPGDGTYKVGTLVDSPSLQTDIVHAHIIDKPEHIEIVQTSLEPGTPKEFSWSSAKIEKVDGLYNKIKKLMGEITEAKLELAMLKEQQYGLRDRLRNLAGSFTRVDDSDDFSSSPEAIDPAIAKIALYTKKLVSLSTESATKSKEVAKQCSLLSEDLKKLEAATECQRVLIPDAVFVSTQIQEIDSWYEEPHALAVQNVIIQCISNQAAAVDRTFRVKTLWADSHWSQQFSCSVDSPVDSMGALKTSVEVCQSTGRDWTNCKVYLSTQNSEGTALAYQELDGDLIELGPRDWAHDVKKSIQISDVQCEVKFLRHVNVAGVMSSAGTTYELSKSVDMSPGSKSITQQATIYAQIPLPLTPSQTRADARLNIQIGRRLHGNLRVLVGPNLILLARLGQDDNISVGTPNVDGRFSVDLRNQKSDGGPVEVYISGSEARNTSIADEFLKDEKEFGRFKAVTKELGTVFDTITRLDKPFCGRLITKCVILDEMSSARIIPTARSDSS